MSGRPPAYDWDSVDWTQSNESIAGSLGCSAHAVRYQRARRDGRKWRHYRDWTVIDWRKSNAEIAAATGRLASMVARARRKYAPETISTRRAPISAEVWATVDWSLPSKVIAETLGCSMSSVSNARRRHET